MLVGSKIINLCTFIRIFCIQSQYSQVYDILKELVGHHDILKSVTLN
mgnify:CR=1 FL=1